MLSDVRVLINVAMDFWGLKHFDVTPRRTMQLEDSLAYNALRRENRRISTLNPNSASSNGIRIIAGPDVNFETL